MDHGNCVDLKKKKKEHIYICFVSVMPVAESENPSCFLGWFKLCTRGKWEELESSESVPWSSSPVLVFRTEPFGERG